MARADEPEGGVPVEGLPEGFGEGRAGQVAFGIAVAFSAFQLWTAAYGSLPSQVVRAMHVGFLLLLGFALLANLRAGSQALKAWFWLLGVLGFATGVYNWVFYAELIRRAGFLTTADLVVGTVLIFLVFEAARRLMGPALAMMRRHLPRLLLLRPVPAAALRSTAATTSPRSSRPSPSAPRASTARRSTSRPPTSSSSWSSPPSSRRPA